MLDRSDARTILQRCAIAPDADFFALTGAQVGALLAEADRLRYRAPPRANGSRGRYFHAYVQRRASQSS